jgi:hypothetical protein
VKRLAADRSRWKSFVAALCFSTGDDRKWWWWWISLISRPDFHHCNRLYSSKDKLKKTLNLDHQHPEKTFLSICLLIHFKTWKLLLMLAL